MLMQQKMGLHAVYSKADERKQYTWIRQPLHHFMQRIRSQTHLTSLTSEEAIRRIHILPELQGLQNADKHIQFPEEWNADTFSLTGSST